jgi:hypothetical protein
VRCSVEKDGNTIDLSPLIKRSGHHLAVSTFGQGATTNGTFYINICRPLNPVYGKLCPPGASVCWDRVGKPPVVSILIAVNKTKRHTVPEYFLKIENSSMTQKCSNLEKKYCYELFDI